MSKESEERPLNLAGFSKLSREERLAKLVQYDLLSLDEAEFLNSGRGINPDLAENFIENSIGYFQIPLGIATNFRIDGRDHAIPMAVEETSIIAAASATAKWVKNHGYVKTSVSGKDIIGQIQIARANRPEQTRSLLLDHRARLIEVANRAAEGMQRRGGGVRDLTVRFLPREIDGGFMVVIHVLMDPVDAMGANIINQVCEALKPSVEELTGERVNICILSNLVDTKLTRAEVILPNIDAKLGEGIAEASLFAQKDPYRAATNNKGILNGVDAVALATGNDWRAVEAGMHAFAARSGVYRSLSLWEMRGRDLVGVMEAPLVVGTVGGVTRLHPTARMCLRMLKVDSAEHLSRVMAAVGLVQNLGALRALSTVGIVQGHMKLHTTNLAMAAGAQREEIPLIRDRLEEILKVEKRVTVSQAVEILEKLRKDHVSTFGAQ
jgi:hydroxymethylglutaryl-CoA reductase